MDDQPRSEAVNFVDHVKGVFRAHCVSCHNPNKTNGDLDLTNYSALMQGSSSGDVIEPGSVDDSYLFQLITHAESPEMPPGGQKIPETDIEVVRKWIADGAIHRSGSKQTRTRKRVSLEMTSAVGVRPENVLMPRNLPVKSTSETTRDPITKSLASRPWSPVIAFAAAKQIVLYHANPDSKNRLLGILPWESGSPETLRFSRDGSRLIAAGGKAAVSGSFAIWNVVTGKKELELGDELDSAQAVDLSADGNQVATGGPERVVRLYFLDSDEADLAPVQLREHTDWVTAVEFSPDGKYLVSADRSGGLILRIAASGESLFRLPSHKAAVTSVSWRGDSKVFASASESGKISIWNLAGASKGKTVKTFEAHPGGCTAIVFAGNGELVSGGRDKKVALWNVKGKQLRAFKGLDEIVTAVCVNDEAGYVFAGSLDGRLKSWRLNDGKSFGSLATNPNSMAVSAAE